jgi:hypothetical protein
MNHTIKLDGWKALVVVVYGGISMVYTTAEILTALIQ